MSRKNRTVLISDSSGFQKPLPGILGATFGNKQLSATQNNSYVANMSPTAWSGYIPGSSMEIIPADSANGSYLRATRDASYSFVYSASRNNTAAIGKFGMHFHPASVVTPDVEWQIASHVFQPFVSEYMIGQEYAAVSGVVSVMEGDVMYFIIDDASDGFSINHLIAFTCMTPE